METLISFEKPIWETLLRNRSLDFSFPCWLDLKSGIRFVSVARTSRISLPPPLQAKNVFPHFRVRFVKKLCVLYFCVQIFFSDRAWASVVRLQPRATAGLYLHVFLPSFLPSSFLTPFAQLRSTATARMLFEWEGNKNDQSPKQKQSTGVRPFRKWFSRNFVPRAHFFITLFFPLSLISLTQNA